MTGFRALLLLVSVGLACAVPGKCWIEPTPAATAGFQRYVDALEAKLAQQHRSGKGYVAGVDGDAQAEAKLHRGELIIEKLTPANGGGMTGALLHHWRGTAFAPGAKAADFERFIRDVGAYPQRYAPQVVQARVVSQQGDRWSTTMRVKQKHVLTVVMDTAYDIDFGRLDARHGYSLSRSSRIAEIASAGTSSEHALGPEDEHGFLWRLNTYWSYEERDDGLYMQVESVSLTRSIPAGLGWAVQPFVESVPRESLEFTLRATCDSLRRPGKS